jgi:predicted ester cyclase
LLGIPWTGKPVSLTGGVIRRVTGGKVVEDWQLADTLGLLAQLGVRQKS